MNETFVFQLSQKLKYTKKGDRENDWAETATITFDPPNMGVHDEATDFEQILMGAIMSAGKGSTKNEEPDEDPNKIPTPSEIKVLLYAANRKDVSVKDIFGCFKKLALKSGKLDDTTYLKKSHFDKMDREDFKNMLCGYASFFSFPSLLSDEGTVKTTGSD